MKVYIEFNGDHIKAYIENKQVGYLDIYTDGNDCSWLNGIEANNGYRRQGIATKMIERAINEFGEVYVSSAS